MKRVWFNHWFSTIYHVFDMLRSDELEEYTIVASWNREHTLIKLGANEFFLEPSNLTEDQYVDWCLKVCEDRNIDIFIPRVNRVAISKKRAQFEMIGTKVMVEDYYIMETLENKARTYEYLNNHGLSHLVPNYITVTNIEEYKKAVIKLTDMGVSKLCMKKTVDEGAKSFILADNYDRVVEQLNGDEYMLMEYLRNEVTCDCVVCGDEVYSVYREKTDLKVHTVKSNKLVQKEAKKVMQRCGLTKPCSIQFRYNNDGELKLLEVNTRMAGGVQISSLGSGVNIPLLGVHNILGIDEYNKNVARNNYESITEKGVTLINLETPFIV